MGYAMVIGTCYSCKRAFMFNPMRVPSLTIDGEREPFCRTCMDRANEIREKKGLPPHKIHSEAYEPINENELPLGNL